MRGWFAALGIATFVACSTYGETAPESAPAADDGMPSDASSSDSAADAATDGGASCAGSRAQVRDDFEGRTVPSAHPQWNGVAVEGLPISSLAILPKQDGWESAFLRATVPALTDPGGSWSYLEHQVTGAPASITVALTVLVTGFTGQDEYVEVASIVERPTDRTFAIFLEGAQLKVGAKNVGKLAVGDVGVRARYSMTVTADAITVRDGNGAQLARVTGSIGPLLAPLHVGVGLVYANPTPGGTIDIDDVVVSY